jgi:hypothetical protein
MRKSLLAVAGILISAPSAGAAPLVLNTGYDHATSALFAIGTQDPYWIKIASYEPPATSVNVNPAWVIPPGGFATFPNARWLAPRSSPLSTTGPNGTGTTPGRPAYSIFRKCFCLLEGYLNPQLAIDLRADDNVQVWLNDVRNTLIAPINGNLGGGPPRSYPSQQSPANPGFFRTGRNCIYVLVEDNIAGGAIGFTLTGSVSAAGLMPNPAIGPAGNFGRCGCPSEPNSADVGPATASDAERETVRAIVQFAEGRRLQALARLSRNAAAGGGALASR